MLKKLPLAEVELNLQLACLFKDFIRERNVPVGEVLQLIPKPQIIKHTGQKKPTEISFEISEEELAVQEALKLLAEDEPEEKKVPKPRRKNNFMNDI